MYIFNHCRLPLLTDAPLQTTSNHCERFSGSCRNSSNGNQSGLRWLVRPGPPMKKDIKLFGKGTIRKARHIKTLHKK